MCVTVCVCVRARVCVRACACVRLRVCVCVQSNMVLRVQIGGPPNGERTIARVNAAGGQVIECGKDGTCMLHSFLVGAILNPALEPAVSQPHRLGRPFSAGVC